jgi:hypothetical protein
MPVRQTANGGGTARSGLAPYWKRLKPVVEYEYKADNDKPLAEVVIFDDRPDTGLIHVQMFPLLNNGRRGKGAVFNFDGPDRLVEVAEDFADAARMIQGALNV